MLRNLQKLFGLPGSLEPAPVQATHAPASAGNAGSEATSFEAALAQRREMLMARCGPLMREALEISAQAGNPAWTREKREAYGPEVLSRLAASTPAERGQFVIDLYRVENEAWHPVWRDYARRQPPPPGITPTRFGLVWGVAIRPEYILRDHELAFSEEGAAELIRLRIGPDPERPFRPSLDKGFVKPLARAFTAPNEDLAALIRNTFGPHKKEYNPLLERLCPFLAAEAAVASPARKGNRHAVAAAEAMDALERELRRRPGLWVRIRPAAGGNAALDHQLHPYLAQVGTVAARLDEAVALGVEVSETVARLSALVDQAQRNLAALEAGQSLPETLGEVLARMPKGENVRTRNIDWTATRPAEERDLFDDQGAPKLALIARIERQWLGELAGRIAGWRKAGADRLPGGDETAGLAARLSDLLPSKSDSKPSKAWLDRARAGIDPGTLDQILHILGSHTPDGSHREEHEALVYLGRAKPPEFRQEQLIAMAWAAHLAPAARAVPVLEGLALRCYAKVPHHGAANLRLGNAATTALSLLPDGEGLPALARLRDLA